MKFCSTRNADDILNFSEAMTQGISREGGLYVPTHFPKFDLDEVNSECTFKPKINENSYKIAWQKSNIV